MVGVLQIRRVGSSTLMSWKLLWPLTPLIWYRFLSATQGRPPAAADLFCDVGLLPPTSIPGTSNLPRSRTLSAVYSVLRPRHWYQGQIRWASLTLLFEHGVIKFQWNIDPSRKSLRRARYIKVLRCFIFSTSICLERFTGRHCVVLNMIVRYLLHTPTHVYVPAKLYVLLPRGRLWRF